MHTRLEILQLVYKAEGPMRRELPTAVDFLSRETKDRLIHLVFFIYLLETGSLRMRSR